MNRSYSVDLESRVNKTTQILIALLLSSMLTPLGAQLTPRPAGRHYQRQVLAAGDTLRYVLYVPDGLERGARVPLVVALHFGGQVTPWMGGDYADMLVAPGLQALGAVIVAPDAADRRGWSERDEARVMELARQVRATYPIDPAKVLLTGFSAGGAQAWALGNRNQDFFTAVIPVSARPPRAATPWRIPVLAIHSRDDGLIPLEPLQEYVTTQKTAGAPVELRVVSGITHHQTSAFAGPLSEAVGWLKTVWP
jgi:poly(3-hydroxybutyrate) depolymerase